MKKLLSFVLHSDFAHTEEFAADAFKRFQASGEKAIVPRLFPALAGSPKLEEITPEITAPTLVIWGKEDKLFPVALAPYITGLVKGAKLTVIEKASHFPQVDQPEAFNAAVKAFLDAGAKCGD
jgi:pimeloyl-ACP methyl ester carboxylesterase